MQTKLVLTKQEQNHVERIIKTSSTKGKLSDVQTLIVDLNAKSNLSETEFNKLRLLLKSEKIREDNLDIKKQLRATAEAEKQQAEKLEQSKESLIGKKIIKAIRENVLLGKDYPYTKLLKKMVEQGLFSTEEQELLAEFLVESNSNFDNNSERNSKNSTSDDNKAMIDKNPQNETQYINQSNEITDENLRKLVMQDNKEASQSDVNSNFSESTKPLTTPTQSTINSDN